MSRILPGLTLAILLLSSASVDAGPPAATSDYDRRRSPVVEVFEQSRDAVVNISTTRVVRMRSLGFDSFLDDIFDFGQPRRLNRKVHSVGSGVVMHESGYIVTNAHVVAQASDVQVTVYRRLLSANSVSLHLCQCEPPVHPWLASMLEC